MFGNNYCRTCANAHNAINGRYCRLIKDYVEYKPNPPCNNNYIKEDENNKYSAGGKSGRMVHRNRGNEAFRHGKDFFLCQGQGRKD